MISLDFKQLERSIAAKPSTEQILGRLAAPFTKILEGLAHLETSPATRNVTTAPPAQAKPGHIRVTFRYEPAKGARGSPRRKAALYWINHGETEKKYTEIPEGLRVVEPSRPGEC